MRTPTESQIGRLASAAPGPFVSIYMPTHRRGADTLQDPTRMKNLLREATGQLQAAGLGTSTIAQLLLPMHELVSDYDFWQHQLDGLIVFRSADVFDLSQVDVPVPELAVVGDSPHLKPMLAVISGDARYYVLALSQNQAAFYRGNRDGLEEVKLADMPSGVGDFQRDDRSNTGLQAHSTSAAGSASHSLAFHGHGSGNDRSDEALQVYLRAVDHAIAGYGAAAKAPLVLATVGYLAPLYRKVNSHPGLQQRFVAGSPDSLAVDKLHSSTLAIALEYFELARNKEADKYFESWHTRRASNELTEILPAASSGRVDTLFVAVGVQIWGTYSDASGEARISELQLPGTQDLLNLAAMRVYLHGGVVYAVPMAEVPGGKPVAAVYRY